MTLDMVAEVRRHGQGAVDMGQDTGAVDMGQDTGAVDMGQDTGAVDMGQDTGAVDMGQDTGPVDMGQDIGAVDMGQDIGAVDMGQDTGVGVGANHNLPDCWKNLGLMMDALEELKDLSEALQNRDIRPSQSVTLIKRQIEVFSSPSREPESGHHYKKACDAVMEGLFNGIELHSDRGQKVIEPEKFYEALKTNMEARMVTEEEESLFEKSHIPRNYAVKVNPPGLRY
ncbi:hypothetical protein N1851_018589 [Merluccius polli]|uniref:Uncharacterized protein n=1 Tax=Merluccius polli TaxID=89951 RepID=A0AA47MMQ9_MERPO|nr:hypothetical protein N1851_018589 [Merluccius polli]